jgi:hypothetical protein
MVRVLVFALLPLAVIGCGRSSLMGHSPFDCPPEHILSDGTCGIGQDLGPHDLGRDMRGDMKDSGFCPDFCKGTCGDPVCCSCSFCVTDPACRIDMKDGGHDGGHDGGDMGLCGDPKNCMLPECVGDPRCHVLGTEVCNNCVDDNDDGLIDCADPQCANFPGCEPGHMCPNPPVCTDPTCACGNQCKNLKCMPTVDFGTINPSGSSSTRMVNTSGTTDVTVTPCAPGGAGMVVGQFTLSAPAAVVLTYSQNKGEDHVFGVFQAGTNQSCGANPVPNACFDPKSATMGSHTYELTNPGLYYVIVQPFEPAGQGPVTVTLSTGCAGASTKEICNNGVDDNCNGLIDCADPDCFTAPNCVPQECKPDFNVGALVVNGPGKMVSFDTTSADVENNLTCEAAKGGKDVVVRFTLKETAGILLNWDQTGDHVVGLMKTPDPGQPCDFNQLSCYDPSARTQDTVAWTDQPPGDYLFIFKSTKPGDEGHIDATISAYQNRRIELCHNGIDDDGNGLIDCADPACIGVAGCSAPYCMPDVQFGNMPIGSSKTARLNVLQNGTNGYKTSCSKGGGKGMVVQLTVPTGGTSGGVGIGFDCTQTGDQVLDLFAAGGPRDACDVNELVCADPKTLPFGCGYEVPNLQPGTYNVIVQAFTAGSEGTVNLTLSVVDDRQLEICNNGIDDDMDGFTDCADRKCATSQYCMHSQCTADATIDPMPLTGQNVFKLVQTSGNGVHATLPCATTPGGQNAVIGLNLTAAADLKLNFQQIGNHDVAVFTNDGTALPCDAGTLVACVKGPGMNQSGMATFTNVPSGRYWIVIGADAPDTMTVQSSGSVNVAISGTPH